MGCRPGSNGAVLEFIGLEPKDVRLADAVACAGERAGDGSLETLVCTPEGRIGRLLSKTMIGLSGKVGRLLPMNLAVPVSEVVAPSVRRGRRMRRDSSSAAQPVTEPDAAPRRRRCAQQPAAGTAGAATERGGETAPATAGAWPAALAAAGVAIDAGRIAPEGLKPIAVERCRCGMLDKLPARRPLFRQMEERQDVMAGDQQPVVGPHRRDESSRERAATISSIMASIAGSAAPA